MATTVALLFFACKKQDNRSNQPQSLKTEAKSYFDDVLAKQPGNNAIQETNRLSYDLLPDWSSVKEIKVQSFSTVLVPLVFSNKMPYSLDSQKERRYLGAPFLAFYKGSSGSIVAEVVYKSPTADSRKSKFEGDILVTSWDGTIKRSSSYKNGVAHRTNVSISYTAAKAKTEGYNCAEFDYFQDVYVGGKYQGTQYLYSKTVCFDDGGGPSGGSGGGGDMGGSGTNPDYSAPDIDPENTNSVDCSAIVFKQTSSANWQEAGITKIRLKWVWSSNEGMTAMRTVYINQVVIGLPLKYANGTEITPGLAASLAATYTDLAKIFTYQEFKNSPYMPDDGTVTLYFRKKLNELMIVKGGTAGVAGSGSPNIIYKEEQRTAWNPYDCK
ncbi:MAG TPA: hypothetical protein VM802_17680 [Chitinophaga sp.]|uniref:hypothetical protein n=1 Tax=Chitinophaga sp. TaxID=1869181 RepID=UPI002B9CA816|nr:hypothetical protein [Chitinophaga sp.]HVI46714.1 hypothetical protein [Chitinophaga sp.]